MFIIIGSIRRDWSTFQQTNYDHIPKATNQSTKNSVHRQNFHADTLIAIPRQKLYPIFIGDTNF